MRRSIITLAALALAPAQAAKPTLSIYTYDSLAAKGGLGPAVAAGFERRCGCEARLLPSGDGGGLAARLEVDAKRGKPAAQLVWGIDEPTWRAIRAHLVTDPAASIARVPRELQVDPGFVPFDYGVLALMADLEQLKKLSLSPPRSVWELAEPKWKKRFVLEDPRASTPGLGFVLFTRELAGEAAFASKWKALSGQWLAMAPSWDAAYGLFLKGEAPLVWSYTTSQAYHAKEGNADRYRALVFEEGNPVQIEGAALVRGPWTAEQARLAREFLDYLLSEEVQALVPEKNWMLPVLPTAKLPASFRDLPRPKKLIRAKADPKATLADWAVAIRP